MVSLSRSPPNNFLMHRTSLSQIRSILPPRLLDQDRKPPKLADLLKSETDKLLNGKPTTQADFVNSILGAAEFADIDWEVKFAFSLLIGDLMTLRARIRWVWDNVKIYKKNLMEAAVATDTAVQLAESMISAVMPLIDRDGGMHCMLCLESLEHCAGGGIKVDHILDGDKNRVSSVTAFSDASYEIADRMFFNTWQLLYFHLYCLPYSKTEINVYDDGKYDKYNPACNHDALPFKAKMTTDKSLSQALFTDLTAIVRNRPGPCYPDLSGHRLHHGQGHLCRFRQSHDSGRRH